jgi:transposase
MSKYIGLDVHVKDTVACVFDKKTNSFSFETVKTTPFSLKRLLRKHPGARATMEISGLTSNLYDELRPCVKEMVVCNPSGMPWIYRTAKKTDRIDAKKQAILLSLGHLPRVYMPSREVREWRATIQHRRSAVQDCCRVKTKIRSLINAHCLRHEKVGSWWTLKNLEWLRSLTLSESEIRLPDVASMHLADLLAAIEFHNAQIKRVSERLDRMAESHVGVQLLMTIPGIGPRTAEAVIAYADDIHRFARSKEFPAYFGLTPKLDESGSTRRMGHISKRGPSAVRWLIVESAWRVIAHSPAMRGFWMRVMRGQRSRKKIAIVAVARKVLTIMRAMLLTGTVWDERLAAPSAPSLR